jgi:hypothetical protein
VLVCSTATVLVLSRVVWSCSAELVVSSVGTKVMLEAPLTTCQLSLCVEDELRLAWSLTCDTCSVDELVRERSRETGDPWSAEHFESCIVKALTVSFNIFCFRKGIADLCPAYLCGSGLTTALVSDTRISLLPSYGAIIRSNDTVRRLDNQSRSKSRLPLHETCIIHFHMYIS